MTTIAVLPTVGPPAGFRAVTDGREGNGPTPGQALDALVAPTGPPAGAVVILLQPPGGDEFFSDAERTRLGDLMARWRAARDTGTPFPPGEQAELNALVAAELRAVTARTLAARELWVRLGLYP